MEKIRRVGEAGRKINFKRSSRAQCSNKMYMQDIRAKGHMQQGSTSKGTTISLISRGSCIVSCKGIIEKDARTRCFNSSIDSKWRIKL